MKNLFKIVLSAAVMAFCLMPANAFQFPDVAKDHWAAKQIEILTDAGVIVGYPDGTFKPDEDVTRAEFASMAIKALGQEHTKVAQPVTFSDITPDFSLFCWITFPFLCFSLINQMFSDPP